MDTDQWDQPGRALVRCYAELNDYLPEHRRQRDFSVSITDRSSVRQLIADLGIPPAEVELVLINGISSGLDCRLRAGDRTSLYPMFESFVSRSPRVESLSTNPDRRARSILAAAPRSIVTMQMRLLAEELLKTLDRIPVDNAGRSRGAEGEATWLRSID